MLHDLNPEVLFKLKVDIFVEVLFFLVPLSLLLAGTGLVACIWAIKTGQFRDVISPAQQLILEDQMAVTDAETETVQQALELEGAIISPINTES